MNADSLTHFLLSLVILVVAAHFFGHWFERIGLPRVIGEISAGILLGPSGIGSLAWGSYNLFLFDAIRRTQGAPERLLLARTVHADVHLGIPHPAPAAGG